jgi:lysophospholipase L1-like esterase
MRLINIVSIATCLIIFSCTKETVSSLPEVLVAKRVVDTSQKVVVILGSSTAFGTGATPIDSSWVNLLNYKFKAEKKNIFIHNLALGGYTTYHIMPSNVTTPNGRPGIDVNRNIDKALSFKPDLIIINLPSNDITYGFTDIEILENYKIICNEIKRNNVEFLITSTQPRNFPEIQARERLAILNHVVKTGFPSNSIDFYDLLADPLLKIKTELDFGDGIHLNNKGHKMIFEEFLKDKKMRLVLGF